MNARLLLADANPSTRKALRLLLKRKLDVQNVSEASDLNSLWKMAVELHPNWLLVDWRLPGMDGRIVLPKMAACWPGMKIIVLSIRPDDERDALEAGAVVFVDKGHSPDIVLKHLRFNQLR
jgi:DNA-binding NarL/FixJ family response regulator